eukprot:TRINITY_DN350_c0_g1_i2.p1 TRINITY_DN350_c0_g1~~TRINITY_DN350_c0_g1_i2.p1  ORF type:complete len:292 (+),score=108.73 TRINITY_DN350_c0_g1_i2:77-952(+)
MLLKTLQRNVIYSNSMLNCVRYNNSKEYSKNKNILNKNNNKMITKNIFTYSSPSYTNKFSFLKTNNNTSPIKYINNNNNNNNTNKYLFSRNFSFMEEEKKPESDNAKIHEEIEAELKKKKEAATDTEPVEDNIKEVLTQVDFDNPIDEDNLPEEIIRLVNEVNKLDQIEFGLFTIALSKSWGIDPTTINQMNFSAGGGGGAGGDGGGGAAEADKPAEKSTKTIKITKLGEGTKVKFAVLKVIRSLKPDNSLAECKKLVDKLPSTIMEDVPNEGVPQIVKQLEDAGATVEQS